MELLEDKLSLTTQVLGIFLYISRRFGQSRVSAFVAKRVLRWDSLHVARD